MNIDEGEGKNIMPFPHHPGFVPDAGACDQMSLQDRMDQIRETLTPEETTLLGSFLAVLSGARLQDAGFYDLVRLWALCGYSVDGVATLCALFKLHDGQSAFARKFFEEALSTRRLSYAFSHPVASINDNGQDVEVTCTNGKSFSSKRIVCTIPYNVLSSVKITPPLSDAQTNVLRTLHVNRSIKVHAEVQPAELRSWMGINYPGNDLIHASGEAITPAGHARLVCFGAAASAQPEDDTNRTVDAVKALDYRGRIQPKRLVFTNWSKDEYARGGWSWLPPLMGTTRDLGVLRQGHGKLLFASADWAVGWRGFIDGAIEEGTRAAKAVREELLSLERHG
jgi:monoamine oxidase